MPSPVPPALVAELAEVLGRGEVRTKEDLHHAKQGIARRMGIPLPPDRDIAAALPADVRDRYAAVLRTKPTRSMSGVAVVAVMSSPASCPHGKCIFCPGGPEVEAPQSYTGYEPSTLRARRHGYDPCAIVRDRLKQLEGNGHAIAKVDVVIQGGTFPARDPAYQDWFVAGIYAGLNAGPAGSQETGTAEPDHEPGRGLRGPRGPAVALPMAGSAGRLPSAQSAAPWASETEWAALTPDERRRRLDALMLANESAACRAIGLTIETKPDWCLEADLDRMLLYGATRIEVGLQALDDDVLRRTHRGHTLDDSRRCLQLARDAGFKVCAHLMPGLPRGTVTAPDGTRSSASNPWSTDATADVDDFRRLFQEPDWRPDMLKVYPTLVVQDGETPLKRLWQEGKYLPLDTAAAADVIAKGKAFVPEWCRIQRVDRDIPTTHVTAGVMNSNLRQYVDDEMGRHGLRPCRCIRHREAGRKQAEGAEVRADRLVLKRTDYEAGGGTECFLALEDPVADAVVAFLRLRKVGPSAHRAETRHGNGSAFIRELKVYGLSLDLGDDPEAGAFQHQGFGTRLLREAEAIAFGEWGLGRLLVIAGVGVKAYYRKHGYSDLGPYVAKEAPC